MTSEVSKCMLNTTASFFSMKICMAAPSSAYGGNHIHREEANHISRQQRDGDSVPRNGDQRASLEEDDKDEGENGASQTDHSKEFFLRSRDQAEPTQSLCFTRTSWHTLLTA